MSKPTVADVLNRAADIIEERGLCRGQLWGKDGTVCTVAAIIEAANVLGVVRLAPTLDEMKDFVGEPTSTWSDTKALDAADVSNHLRKAAERWAERAQP